MSYEPTVWKSGDIVTSLKLNKMEQGIADASSNSSTNILYIHVDDNDHLDKTLQEIIDAMPLSYIVMDNDPNNICYAQCIAVRHDTESVPQYMAVFSFYNFSIFEQDVLSFGANSLDDYPGYFSNDNA